MHILSKLSPNILSTCYKSIHRIILPHLILSTEFSHECQVIKVSHFNVHTVTSSIMVSAISDDTKQTQSMVQNHQVIIRDSENSTPILPSHLKGVSLDSAAAKGDIEAVKVLMKEDGADVESKDFNGWTPLSWAADNGRLDMVKFLVEEGGAHGDSKDWSGNMALAVTRASEGLEKLPWETEAECELRREGRKAVAAWLWSRGRSQITERRSRSNVNDPG